jgi:hypothetical protein
MTDYYRILKISPKASAAEIKSAYRRLARKLHPDISGGSEENAREFAKIAKAYQILSNPTERARYDGNRVKSQNGADNDSVMFSDNPHARRLRRMAVQRRMDAIVDKFIERDRADTRALQQTVFPVVALFISTFFVGMLKPQFWANSDLLGKTIVVALFVAGLWHLFRRFRFSFALYTRSSERLHNSVLRDEDDEEKPFSKLTATSFLLVGVALSLGIGVAVGKYLEILIMHMMPNLFSATLHPELIFYPPIAVLIVDTMHTVASKADL